MSASSRRIRQYVGLAIVVTAYVGGMIGWSWAALTVESEPGAPDTTYRQQSLVPDTAEAEPVALRNAEAPTDTSMTE